MLFNSFVFILLFLPVTLAVYYGLNKLGQYKAAKLSLILASLVFYGYNEPRYVPVILGSIALNYGCYRLILAKPRWNRGVVALGVAANLALLGYFKYFDFLLMNINALAGTSFDYLRIALPLGISFFTFQQISFVVDAGKGTCRCENVLDYVLFVTFFPQLVAGPIVTHDEILPQLAAPANRGPRAENFVRGLRAFSIGLFKKVVIADSFGKIVALGYQDVASLNTIMACLTVFSYTVQIYFDFSGYCDMASGIGWLFNVELPVNFDSPYKAATITEFWKRWHITLTRFLTKYVYIPLGGNRKGTGRTYWNIFLVFLASGLWHGAGYTFLLWGLLHGIANVLTRVFSEGIRRIPRWICWCVNFLFLNLTWTVFRAESISQAVTLLGRVFSGGFVVSDDLQYQLRQMMLVDIPSNHLPFRTVVMGMCAMVMAVALFAPNTAALVRRKGSVWNLLGTVVLFVISLLSLSGVSTFLYFNF